MKKLLAGFFLLCCFAKISAAESLSLPISKNTSFKRNNNFFYPGSLVILPRDGRQVFLEAFAAAQCEIRIEICVLEDPIILEALQKALLRGISVKVIVDRSKYETLPLERINLAKYLQSAGGKLHLSNPIFPRSFPKVTLIDDCSALIGTACLDTTTFEQYRDYVYVSARTSIIKLMSELFENDWRYSAPPGAVPAPFNPTPPINQANIIIAPVNASNRLVALFQQAHESLDLTSELLGNPTLESELAAAVSRGVKVRLIAPQYVNGASSAEQALQIKSLNALKGAGVKVHVTLPPESAEHPYMHARTAIIDNQKIYLGSISLSLDSATYDRGVGLILDDQHIVKKMQRQFEIDYIYKSQAYMPFLKH